MRKKGGKNCLSKQFLMESTATFRKGESWVRACFPFIGDQSHSVLGGTAQQKQNKNKIFTVKPHF